MEISIVPKFIVRNLSEDSVKQMHWNVLISSILVILTAGLIKMSFMDAIPHVCLFDKLAGLPCPGCGITSSIMSLYELRILESLHYNPNGLLLFLSLLFQIPLRIVALLNEDRNALIHKISIFIGQFLLTTLLIYWILQIIHLKYSNYGTSFMP